MTMEHSISYSIPYILLVVFYLALSVVYPLQDEDDGQKVGFRLRLNVISFVVFLLFFGFRGFIGDDWTNYYRMFDKCSFDNIDALLQSMQDTSFEPGFFLLNIVCKAIFGDNYIVFQFICTLITLLLLYKFLRRYVDNIPLGFALYLCMGGFVMSTNLMRNSISILLFANVLHLIVERKAFMYYLTCLLALSFHYSALLYFPVYFFFHKKISKWVLLVIFFILNVLYVAHVKFATQILLSVVSSFGEVYEKILEAYVEGKYGDVSTGLSIGYLERVFTFFLLFCYYDKLYSIRKDNVVLLNCAAAYFFLYFFFYEFSVFAGRMSNVFTMFYWVLWADLIRCFSIKNNRYLFLGFICLYCIMKITGLTNLETLRYDNFITGAQTYEERLYIHQKYEDDEEL